MLEVQQNILDKLEKKLPEVGEILQLVSQQSKETLSDSFNLLLEREKELIQLLWWKWYNTLLLIELSNELWFKVPHTELISTDFYKKLFNVWNDDEQFKSESDFSNFLNEIDVEDNNKKKTSVEKFLKTNIDVTKAVLKKITLEELKNKYSILLELYCDINWYDFHSTEINEESIDFFYIWDDWEKYEYSSTSIDWFIKKFNTDILFKLWYIKEKTYEELMWKSGSWDRYDDMAYSYECSYDLEKQVDNFLGDINEVILKPEEEEYLKEIFDKFSNSKFIAIRSSANVEDWWKYNYPGIFYTWFCATDDFESFKLEVIKVLESSKSEKVDDYQKQRNLDDEVIMWIVVMDVEWEKYNDIWFDKPISNFLEWPVYLPMRKKEWSVEKLFYPDGGWVVTADDLVDDSFIRIKWVKWMPTSVTSTTNQEIVADVQKDNWKILGYENQPWDFNYYKQTWVAGINSEWKIRYHLEALYESDVLREWGIKVNMCYDDFNNSGWLKNINFLPFSQDQYKKIACIYTALEHKYWNSLELEFVVNNWDIYILQSRKTISNFVKPDNIKRPNEQLVWEVLLWKNDIISSMWYIDNEEIDIISIEPIRTEEHGLTIKSLDDNSIYKQMIELEKRANNWYFITIEKLMSFPEIHKNDFSNLRWIAISWFKWLWTHALMIIRECWIPVIFCDIDSNLKISWKHKVYIEGNKWAMIYK